MRCADRWLRSENRQPAQETPTTINGPAPTGRVTETRPSMKARSLVDLGGLKRALAEFNWRFEEVPDIIKIKSWGCRDDVEY